MSQSSTLERIHSDLIAKAILLYAFDAAFPAPPSVYKSSGGIAANVYIAGNYAQGAAHVAALRAAGVGPWPNYEVGLWELVSNRSAGQAAGRSGIAGARNAGFPNNGTIWFPFSVDVAVDPTRYYQVADAFRGIQDVNIGQYLISFYGQGGLAAYLRANHIINQKCWLSASASFPGWNPSSSDICIWQQVGNFISGYSTDRNVITDVAALHAWWPSNSPYTGGLSVTDVQNILNAIKACNDDVNTNYQNLVQQIGEPTHPQTNSLRNAILNAIPSADISAVKANTDTVEATQILQTQQLNALKAQVAGLNTPTVDAIVAAIKADPPPGWSPTDSQLAAIAAAISKALPPITPPRYAGSFEPVPPVTGV